MQLSHQSRANFSAFTAYLGAPFAIIQFLRTAFAFLCTGKADLGTRLAQMRRELSSYAEQPRIGRTDDSTFPGKCNTPGQHLDIILLQTLRCTVLALAGAAVTCLYAMLIHTTAETLILHDLSTR